MTPAERDWRGSWWTTASAMAYFGFNHVNDIPSSALTHPHTPLCSEQCVSILYGSIGELSESNRLKWLVAAQYIFRLV